MLEKMFNVWDQHFHYEIGSDCDGLDMLEIRYYDGQDTKSSLRVSFTKEHAKLIAKALLELAEENTND